MNTAPEAAGIVAAAGEHVPGLLERVERRLRDIAASGGAAVGPLAGDTIAAGGKRLRPLLLIVAAGEPDGAEDALVRAGAAVELVHSATLVHDDVLDGADLRRGRPTVVARAGRLGATTTGDFLFARAFSEIVANGSAEQVRVLSGAGSALARGELLQREDAWNADVRVERYLERCELKTARLFEAACALGQLCTAAPDTADGEQPLAAFGRGIGIAFQLLDDVLDVEGPAERIGKPRGADLLDGTVTLPLILARQRDPGLAELDVRTIRTADAAGAVSDRIAATGSLEDVRARALALVASAKDGLPDTLAGGQRLALELVADSVVERYA